MSEEVSENGGVLGVSSCLEGSSELILSSPRVQCVCLLCGFDEEVCDAPESGLSSPQMATSDPEICGRKALSSTMMIFRFTTSFRLCSFIISP